LEKEGILKEKGIKKSDLKNVKLYAKRKITFKKWERDLIKDYNTCNSNDVKKNKKKFMLVLNFYQVQELIDIKPGRESYYLRAITEPHNEEMEISEERFVNWIKHFNMQGLNNGKFERAHISGHISGKELAEFIKEIKPEIVIPIHTEFPEEFKKIHKKVKIVEKGETLSF